MSGLFLHCGGETTVKNGTGKARDSGTAGAKDASANCIRADGVALKDGESTSCGCAVGDGKQTCVRGKLSPCVCSAGSPFCGNNIAEGSELCDGADIRGETCGTVTMLALPNGPLRCAANCIFDTAACFGGGTGGAGGMFGAGGTFGAGGAF